MCTKVALEQLSRLIYFTGLSFFVFMEDLKFGVLNTKMTKKHGTFHLYVDIVGNMVKDKSYDPQVYANKHQLK